MPYPNPDCPLIQKVGDIRSRHLAPAHPGVLLSVSVGLIFLTESAIMYVLETVESNRPLDIWYEVLVDATVLSVVVLPLLYYLFYRPLATLIAEHRLTEQTLKQAGEDMEARVARRTKELDEANRRLRREALDRKDVLEALHYSEQKYCTLVENSPTGIFIQREGKLAFVNQQLADMLGYSREEMIAIGPEKIIHPGDWPRVREIMEKRLRGEEAPTEYETRAVTKAGETRWAHLQAVPIQYRGGRSTLGNVLDVTPRKQAEEALEESEDSLRKLSARLMRAQEDERAKIARDLHDGVGQSLTAIKFAIESAMRGPECAACPLADLVPRMQELITEVRQISLGLRPSILDDLGVIRTLHWQCKEVEAHRPELEAAVRCELREGDVPEPLKIVVFRIVQEALTNAAKHSGAKRVTVSLEQSNGSLELVVEDDGCGLPARPPDRDRTGEGFGINSMRERTGLSGGQFSLRTEAGAGTAVRAVWPLRVAEATR